MKTHKHCLICQSKNISGLRKYERHFLNYCLNCGFVFSERIPSHRELEEHYKGYSRDDYLSPLTIKRYNELLDYFEQFRKTNNLLDIGCGMGYFLVEAKKRGWNVFGTEFTDTAIKICKQKEISMKKGVFNPPATFTILVCADMKYGIRVIKSRLKKGFIIKSVPKFTPQIYH